MNTNYFVTGIGTEIGKTVISAILVEKLNADYWKPIQSGDLDNSDSQKVKAFVSNSKTIFHDEAFRLSQPYSPHYSAELDKVTIHLSDFHLPKTNHQLIVEGAGGLMVPLNYKDLMIDLIKQLNLEVILVSKNYLGSINHTLLSVEALKNRAIPIKGIIFNGNANPSSENVIKEITGLKILGNIPQSDYLNKEKIKSLGALITL